MRILVIGLGHQWSFVEMCNHLREHGTVHVNGVAEPLSNLPDWVAGLDLLCEEELKVYEPEFCVHSASYDEMRDTVMRRLPLAVQRARFRSELLQ